LERPLPATIRTVPSCIRCNHGASMDEQYFFVVLGYISSSPYIAAKLAPGGVINRTLERSPALDERLFHSLGFDDATGSPCIRPEIARLNSVVRKVAIGLFALRYGRAPAAEQVGPVGLYPYVLLDERPLPYFVSTFTERFKSKQWRTVQPGVFRYIFVRSPQSSSKVWCIMDIYQSLWGVVHFPNPKSRRARQSSQLWLFPELRQ
jgi:hypothetical protein